MRRGRIDRMPKSKVPGSRKDRKSSPEGASERIKAPMSARDLTNAEVDRLLGPSPEGKIRCYKCGADYKQKNKRSGKSSCPNCHGTGNAGEGRSLDQIVRERVDEIMAWRADDEKDDWRI